MFSRTFGGSNRRPLESNVGLKGALVRYAETTSNPDDAPSSSDFQPRPVTQQCRRQCGGRLIGSTVSSENARPSTQQGRRPRVPRPAPPSLPDEMVKDGETAADCAIPSADDANRTELILMQDREKHRKELDAVWGKNNTLRGQISTLNADLTKLRHKLSRLEEFARMEERQSAFRNTILREEADCFAALLFHHSRCGWEFASCLWMQAKHHVCAASRPVKDSDLLRALRTAEQRVDQLERAHTAAGRSHDLEPFCPFVTPSMLGVAPTQQQGNRASGPIRTLREAIASRGPVAPQQYSRVGVSPTQFLLSGGEGAIVGRALAPSPFQQLTAASSTARGKKQVSTGVIVK